MIPKYAFEVTSTWMGKEGLVREVHSFETLSAAMEHRIKALHKPRTRTVKVSAGLDETTRIKYESEQ